MTETKRIKIYPANRQQMGILVWGGAGYGYERFCWK